MLDWIETHIPPWAFIAVIAHFAVLGTVAYLILLERKTASWVQDRLGPNRVGFDFGLPFLPKFHFWGLGQPLADGLKFILKEDYRPRSVDKILFTIAPAVMIIVVIVSIAVLPWGGWKETTKSMVVASWAEGETPAQIDDAGVYDREIRARLPSGVQFVNLQQWTDDGMQEGNRIVQPPPGIAPKHYRGVTVTYRYPFQIANLNIGVLFILAVLSLSVYGVVIGGWASNNKYSFLGGLRATANMISYEIPLGLAVLCIVLMFGTLDLSEIVEKQATYWGHVVPAWNVFSQPLAFLMFLVCIHAEANRAPFDLAEAEQELVGGYHTEYSAMRFALFFLAEYAGMITTSAVCVALFFGGWHLPWIDKLWPALAGTIDPAHPAITTSMLACLVRAVVFFAKTLLIIFIFMWVRWSLPRFRFDQLMMLAWRALIPIALALLMMTAIVLYFTRHLPHAYGRMGGVEALILLVANVALAVLTLLVSRLLPAPPETNRRVHVGNSRFTRTPLPGGATSVPALSAEAAATLPVSPVPMQAAGA
jgi:NADH-quinone oxidoreductase subunit H